MNCNRVHYYSDDCSIRVIALLGYLDLAGLILTPCSCRLFLMHTVILPEYTINCNKLC